MKSALETNKQRQPPAQPKQTPLTIVGIGASAGGVKALSWFFDALPADPGMAFVVVTHLAPNQESLLPQILGERTTMPVHEVQGPLAVQPNHLYVISPGLRILMSDSHIDVDEFAQPRGSRTPIDDFFRSLAAVHRSPIAVILSGSGTDGAVGVKAIKEKGGLLLVQHPDEAEYEEMPRAAIATGLADLVLPVAELVEKALNYHQNSSASPSTHEQPSNHEQSLLRRILTQVEIQTGHDLSRYREETLLRRIRRRMHLFNLQTLEGYLEFLRHTPDEPQQLFNDLLVGVTTFFRKPESWEALAGQVIPQLFADKEQGNRIRVWSIGCATGEEAYSLAILLLEEAERWAKASPQQNDEDETAVHLQIFASDLDEQALHRARQGLYPDVIEADLSPERLERFFTREGNYYRIQSRVREIVIFTSHSVLYHPPFSQLDLISSRNLLTHLQPMLQRTVLEIFFFALNPGGYLFLDRLDALEISAGLFETVDQDNHIYAVRPDSGTDIPIIDTSVARQQTTPQQALPSTLPLLHLPVSAYSERAVEKQHQQALELFSPPSLLVTEDYHVLHLSESVGRYLLPRRGPITSHLLQLVRPELQQELEIALIEVFQQQKPVLTAPVFVQFNGEPHQVLIFVRPLKAAESQAANVQAAETAADGPQAGEETALVCFLEIEASTATTDSSPDQAGEPDSTFAETAESVSQKRVSQLEQEVERLHFRLQRLTEWYETANEELKATNEELQSLNEEYHTTMEELETSKEELSSVNEELQTTNVELDQKLAEISRTFDDMQNLIAATQIPILFLDRDLLIQRYTEATTQLFPLQPHDIGRHISHLAHQLNYSNLVADAQQVLSTLTPIEREVNDNVGRWLQVRQQPYLTGRYQVNGVVLTFIDITQLKQTEAALREAEAHLEQRVAERTAQVRQLASELVASEQTVRQRIAQSLHDNLQQTLYAAKMQLQFLKEDVGEKTEINNLIKTVSHSLTLTRQLTLELSPPVLEEEGLLEALRWLSEHMEELYGLNVTVRADDHPDTATAEQRILLYQIIRELLFNIVKHAGVQEAEIRLAAADGGIVVTVSDEGKGFDVSAKTAEPNTSFGLRSIQERLQLFDGWAKINSKPGDGTQVRLFLPHLHAEHHNNR